MNATTPEPLARDALDQFLNQLTDEQKKYVLVKLLGPVLAPIKERRAFYDENGRLLGDYVPIPRIQPGQRIGMTEEERDALLASTVFKTRAQWDAERAAAKAAGGDAK